MRPNLQLVKPLRARQQDDREAREIRFRYPAEEPMWEVSCSGARTFSSREASHKDSPHKSA